MEFQPVTTRETLDSLLGRDAILFKHSERCGISQDRKKALEGLDEDVTVHTVEVREERGLSNMIADETGVTHESPQLLVLRDGDVVWHASHMAISPDKLQEHL